MYPRGTSPVTPPPEEGPRDHRCGGQALLGGKSPSTGTWGDRSRCRLCLDCVLGGELPISRRT